MGIDSDIFDILNWEIRKFSIACHVIFRPKGFKLSFVSVYGSPYEEGKDEFISELHEILISTSGPLLLGGDFNLVRYQTDKSNGIVDQKWCDKFNSWIEIWSLLEIRLSNRRFTWANNQENLIMSTIDRIFCNTEIGRAHV